MSKRLFIVSNRLPVTIEQTGNFPTVRQSSGGLVSAISSYLERTGKNEYSSTVWAGVPGCSREVWALAGNDSANYTYLPVFIDDGLYDAYYNGFSNSLLWPLFHYFPSYADYTTDHFDAYMQANEAFATALLAQLKPGDVVWIHDYHLLPLAGLLRQQMASLSIGFFLHIPFPSYELFRVIPKRWQHALLTGMLGADLIGFHTVDYSGHFLSCLQMVLRLEHDGQWVFRDNRRIRVDSFPISIDFERFHHAGDDPAVQAVIAAYRQVKGDRRLIFSVDRLDYTKGISNRLQGYERFLLDNPEYAGKVIFALTVVPSRDSIDKYAERKRMIDEYIGNLNSRLGSITWQPVIYQYTHLTFEELSALYLTCDLALITPLRDGMNLVAKEFAAARNDGAGVLVLSEMAGASKELTEALLINPNDHLEMAEMIRKGLEMPLAEQQERMAAMQERIRRYDVVTWAADFFEQLHDVKKDQLDFEVKFIDHATKINLLQDYAAADRRLLLLDYDGTLVPFAKFPSGAVPGAALLETLEQLAANPQNEVYIISGRDSHTLEAWMGHLPVGLIAEHGARMKYKDGGWDTAQVMDTGWKNNVARVMNRYVAKCPHSFIEQKEFSLAWHYRNCALTESAVRAKELYDDLMEATAGMPLHVLQGNKVLEVRAKDINKGRAVEALMHMKSYGFTLAVGDDKTDEDMFYRLAKLPEAYTIKVGNEASFAKYNLHNPSMVLSLLQTMAQYHTTG